MKAALAHLHPYKSLVLAEMVDPKQSAKGLLTELLDDLESALGLDGNEPSLKLVYRQEPTLHDQTTEIAFLQFTQTQPPAWTSQENINDLTNHLVLLFRHGPAVAIYCSAPGLRQSVMSRIDDEDGLGLAKLQRISRKRLNAAFVQGKTRTLWLSGVHRRTSIKADSKILAGTDLQDALNPLDDQTYNFTAVRCAADVGNSIMTVGSVPSQSRVWFGRSKNWTDFCASTIELLSHLQKVTRGQDAPLPILARTTANAASVQTAFDFGFQPPELLGSDGARNHDLELLEKLAYDGSACITATNGTNFEAEISINSKVIGSLNANVDVSDPEHVKLNVTGKAAADFSRDTMDQIVHLARRPAFVTIRFDSGHTISDGTVVELQHRDMPFMRFQWVDFGKFNVDQEKPTQLAQTGKQKSLFCWVQQIWPIAGKHGGWLACDDGAGELADFVHIDDTAAVPIVSLIHVKGSGSKTNDRGISVSDYEVVTGQAVKNLRHIDRKLLAEGLEKGIGKQISKLVWHNRKPDTRAKFLDALRKVSASHRRQVIIIQPRVTQVRHDAARKNPQSADAARLRQLDTLLIGAEMNCRAMGADFHVVTAAGGTI